jgi:hypothetical protein
VPLDPKYRQGERRIPYCRDGINERFFRGSRMNLGLYLKEFFYVTLVGNVSIVPKKLIAFDTTTAAKRFNL